MGRTSPVPSFSENPAGAIRLAQHLWPNSVDLTSHFAGKQLIRLYPVRFDSPLGVGHQFATLQRRNPLK